MEDPPKSLEQLLERLGGAPAQADDKFTVASLLQTLGERSFGPLLLFAGAILMSPLSGIPGMPTTMGTLVLLVSLQLLLRRDHFWLPGWVLHRSIRRRKVEKAVEWLRPPARFLDRLARPRLLPLVRGVGVYVVAATCALIALAVPFMEVVPFSATLVGVALTAFGLSLTARDGLFAALAFGFTAGAIALVAYPLR